MRKSKIVRVGLPEVLYNEAVKHNLSFSGILRKGVISWLNFLEDTHYFSAWDTTIEKNKRMKYEKEKKPK